MASGRSEDARGPNQRELNQTTIVAVPIAEASAKVRTGPPEDDEDDLDLEVWAGVLPLRLEPGEPEPAPDLKTGLRAPAYVTEYRRPGP